MDTPDLTYTKQERLEDLLSRCLRVAMTHLEGTTTCRAAAHVAAFAAYEIEHPRLLRQESPDELQKIAELLRDIIRIDPDDSKNSSEALRRLRFWIAGLSSPRSRRPTDAQIAAARQHLGSAEDDLIVVEIDGDGELIARRICENFQRVPFPADRPSEGV